MIPIPTILSLIEWAVTEEPKLQQSIQNIFSKPDPTPADWQAERDAWAQTYEQLVPDTKLPKA